MSVLYSLLQLLGFSLISYAVFQEITRPKNMPPTPGNKRPLPFIGHMMELPKSKAWITFRKWNEQYGPLLTVWNGRVPTVLVGDAEIALELLERRSAKYSSRPRFIVVGDLLNENKTVLFAKYGERWRAYRKALHMGTMQKNVDNYLHIFEWEGRILANNLLKKPEDWYHQIFRYTASSVVAITYGRRVMDTRTDSAYLKLSQNVEFMIKMNVPGAQWYETFPILARLPSFISTTKRLALTFRELTRDNMASLVDEVRQKMNKGVAPLCYTRDMLQARDSFPLDDIEFNQQPGSLFAAGVDTTSSTLQSCVLALVLHPEAQAKAHEEMDRVIGSDRSPTWEDEENLVYLKAFIKEVMRWRPVAILGGTAHASTEDDVLVYEGKEYFIPAGATVMAPLWSLHMNPNTYEDPEKFKPDRFLDGRTYAGTGGRGHSAFGWGRRVCPGAYFAERSLFLTTARLLWAFNFSPTVEPSTKKLIIPDASIETGYSSGFNVRPLPFPCEIKVRNERIKAIIEKEDREAESAFNAAGY